MNQSEIENMAQGLPPSQIGKDHEEVVIWLATQLLDAQQKLDALAAENAARKGFFETGITASFEGCDFFGDHMQSRALELGLVREEVYCKDQHENLVADPASLEDGDAIYFINETPTTNAYLNSVRAEGVKILTGKLQQLIDEGVFDAKEIGVAEGVVHEGAQIAAQLRGQ